MRTSARETTSGTASDVPEAEPGTTRDVLDLPSRYRNPHPDMPVPGTGTEYLRGIPPHQPMVPRHSFHQRGWTGTTSEQVWPCRRFCRLTRADPPGSAGPLGRFGPSTSYRRPRPRSPLTPGQRTRHPGMRSAAPPSLGATECLPDLRNQASDHDRAHRPVGTTECSFGCGLGS